MQTGGVLRGCDNVWNNNSELRLRMVATVFEISIWSNLLLIVGGDGVWRTCRGFRGTQSLVLLPGFTSITTVCVGVADASLL